MQNKSKREKSLILTTNTVTVTAGGVVLESFNQKLLLDQLKKLQLNSQKQTALPAVADIPSKS
jgi:hypothetical protein